MKRVAAIICLLLLLCASSAYSQTHVVLVRHAEKLGGDDPGLTEEGKIRAEELSRMLSGMEIIALYSTPYNRTRETLLPLAERTGLEVQSYPPIDMGAIRELIMAQGDGTVVLSGHSNTIPSIANMLAGEEQFETLPEWQYDDLFIVTLYEGNASVIHLKYGARSEEH